MTPRIEDSVAVPLAFAGQIGALSSLEQSALLDASQSGLYKLFRRCCLAVLNSGNESDDTQQILDRYRDFEVRLGRRAGGLELVLSNAPPTAFVDGALIQGIREHLYAVLRDILFVHHEVHRNPRFDLQDPQHLTSVVFHLLRNADVLKPQRKSRLAVCWGGHSIPRVEYEYTKLVGYELGLRGFDISTGCGPGAMKGPMKGAAIGHSKQRMYGGRYVGISEPDIIAAEAPNPIVNELVIMPDIEKRLEAFVRLGHGFVIFPGGAGTAEELLYILGVLLQAENAALPFPLILTGPPESRAYFDALDGFLGQTLGPAATKRYRIIVDDPEAVAQELLAAVVTAEQFRAETNDAPYFQWNLAIDAGFQAPFKPTHGAMSQLALRRDQPDHLLAANLRRVFSGVVAGNIKSGAMDAVDTAGPFRVEGAADIVRPLQSLLDAFAAQGRMTLEPSRYRPTLELVPVSAHEPAHADGR